MVVEDGDFPCSYVSLPEGNHYEQITQNCHTFAACLPQMDSHSMTKKLPCDFKDQFGRKIPSLKLT